MFPNIILNDSQIESKLKRIAYEIIEDNFEDKHITIVSFNEKGDALARRITTLINVTLYVQASNFTLKDLLANGCPLKGKSLVIVSDLINTAKSMLEVISFFTDKKLRKIRTAVLINRKHNLFPINANFSGLELSTTKADYVVVNLQETDGQDLVYLR